MSHFNLEPAQPLNRLQHSLLSYADRLRMERKPGGKNIHPHRFRKTLAWICALAITHSPKILKDVFGHKSFDMTLYYILADKSLAMEIERVSRELRVIRAKEVIEKIVAAEDLAGDAEDVDSFSSFGGAAAAPIVGAVRAERIKIFRRGEDWNESSAVGLAQVLTMQGTHWEYVRPGVICTKTRGQPAPCTNNRGNPDPASCTSRCLHRLEEAFLKADVDGTIAELVNDYSKIETSNDLLTKSFLAEQISQQVIRFPDLKLKWSEHRTVAHLLQEVRN